VSAPGFQDAFTGSVFIMVFSVLGSLALGTPLAFAMARRGVRRGVLMTLLPVAAAAPIVVPQTVIGVSYYSSTLLFQIPLGYLPTIVAHIMLSSPFVGIILSLRLSTADPYIAEAARDLGAKNVYRTRTVTLPMLLPSIVGVGFLVAAFSMDEVLVTTFTIGANSTLPVWMLSQARQGLNPGINALAVILLLGTLTLFAAAALSMLALRLRRQSPSVALATGNIKDRARGPIPA
jgi:ABC-type spermidine/putrescine transport system permease subunit II